MTKNCQKWFLKAVCWTSKLFEAFLVIVWLDDFEISFYLFLFVEKTCVSGPTQIRGPILGGGKPSTVTLTLGASDHVTSLESHTWCQVGH